MKKLEQSGLNQSKLDYCLFVGEKVTCIVYVDGLIFWARNEDNIHNLEIYLLESGVDLNQEDDDSGFFGVTLGQESKTGSIEMKETGLIQHVVEAVVLDNVMVRDILHLQIRGL